MAEIIKLSDKKSITPKSETFEHAGQRYTCTFDPNAPPGEKWVWRVKYMRAYLYFGNAQTLEKASVKARKLIHSMNKHVIDVEENSE